MTDRKAQASRIDPELADVVDFLRQCMPFSILENAALMTVARSIEVSYHRKGEKFQPHDDVQFLRIVRAGALEIRNPETLLDRMGERECVNLKNLSEENPEIFVVAMEDSLVYNLDLVLVQQQRQNNRELDRFFHNQRARRLRRAARYSADAPQLMLPLSDMLTNKVVSVDSAASVVDAAKIMVEKRISSLIILDDDALVGILTDRDIRTRLVAESRSLETTVADIMTENPAAIEEDATLFDAMLMMSQMNIHHLPVVLGTKPIGMLTVSDVVKTRESDPIFVIQGIAKQSSVDALRLAGQKIPELVKMLVSQGARSSQVSRVASTVADHIGRRLLQLAEAELGPAPVPYCWLLFGSQARHEMVLGGDQDNAMVVSNDASEADMEYFANLAKIVCDGLNSCGYDYCRGGIMASNPEWLMRLDQWCGTVSKWVRSPTPDAVMRVSIFFDIRGLYGNLALAETLQAHMLDNAAKNSIFMAMLASNAVSHRPPLGFFRRFVLEANGEHKDTLDLKHRGIIPVVDYARVEALAHHVTEVSTEERLNALAKMGKMALSDARNLIDAASFLMQIRLENQHDQLSRGEQPNNFVLPSQLSDIQCKHLKDAFSVIKDAQEGMGMRYTRGVV